MDLTKENIEKEIIEIKEKLESNEKLLVMTADVMEAFDKDRTGFLSPDDFLTCVLEFNDGPFGIEGFSADQLNEYLSKFDLDKDGKLSEKEVKLFVIDRLKCTIQKFQKLLNNEN